jgi:hypothetical protein
MMAMVPAAAAKVQEFAPTKVNDHGQSHRGHETSQPGNEQFQSALHA